MADVLYSFGPGIFNVREFGAVGDGTTNDRNAIQAAADAAFAYANTVNKTAIVYFPPATYVVSGRINWLIENKGLVVFRGAPATIKMGNLGSGFVTATWANSAGNFGNVTIEDLVFDNNNQKKNWAQCGIIFNIDRYPTQFTSIKNITIRRCEVRNAPRGSTNDPFIIGVAISIYVPDNTNRTWPCSVENILVEDCVFGKIGYGGSYGVQIQANFGSGALVGSDYSNVKSARVVEWACNVFMDNIVLRRLWHDGGPPSQTYYSNSNYIVGASAHGNRLICEDLYGTNSGDDGLEVNSFYDIDITRCQFSNSQVGSAILLNNGGGMPYPERQRISINDCRFGPTSGLNGGSAIIQRYNPGAPHGAIHISNCYLSDGSINMRGAYQQLMIRGVQYFQANGATNGGFTDSFFIDIDCLAGKSQIVIDDVTGTYAYNYANPNNTNNSYVNISAIRLNTLIDAMLDIKNVQVINNIVVTAGVIWGGGPNISVVKLPVSQGVNLSTFTTDDFSRWFDQGSWSDAVVANNVLSPSNTADLAAEARAVSVSAGTSYWSSGTGPQTDINVEAQYVPGTDTTGIKLGVVGRAPTATTYTEAYVFDDGTHSYLCLDKVTAGARLSLLGDIVGGPGLISGIPTPMAYTSDRGIQLVSRITSGVSFYVRYRQQGPVVSADYHTASMGWTSTVTATAPATFVTSSEIRNFVERPAHSGFVWVPISIDTAMDTYRYYRMNVFSGTFENISYATLDTLPLTGSTFIANATTKSLARLLGAHYVSSAAVLAVTLEALD
jgi:hypothetical protein